MEYGEFNSINTSLVEYERTTKRVPTMKPLDGPMSEERETASIPEGAAAPKPVAEKMDFSQVKIEPLFEEMVDFDTFAKSDLPRCEDRGL